MSDFPLLASLRTPEIAFGNPGALSEEEVQKLQKVNDEHAIQVWDLQVRISKAKGKEREELMKELETLQKNPDACKAQKILRERIKILKEQHNIQEEVCSPSARLM